MNDPEIDEYGVKPVYDGGYVSRLGITTPSSGFGSGWLVYRHADGHWVTLVDLKRYARLIPYDDGHKPLPPFRPPRAPDPFAATAVKCDLPADTDLGELGPGTIIPVDVFDDTVKFLKNMTARFNSRGEWESALKVQELLVIVNCTANSLDELGVLVDEDPDA